LRAASAYRRPSPAANCCPASLSLRLASTTCSHVASSSKCVASGQGRQRHLQGWPFIWNGTCGTVQQALQRLLLTLAPHSTSCFRAPRRLKALLSASAQGHPFLQLRVHSQPRCVSDGIDKTAHVVIPAALR